MSFITGLKILDVLRDRDWSHNILEASFSRKFIEEIINELMEVKECNLGKYNGNDVLIKNGRYGTYVECGDIKETLKDLEVEINNVTLDDVINILETSTKTSKLDKSILRELRDDLSIRQGKFGAYVYYKTDSMKKPEFLNIKKFKESFLTCEKELLLKFIDEQNVIYLDESELRQAVRQIPDDADRKEMLEAYYNLGM